MDKFIVSAIIAGLFVLAKTLEAKFIKKEESPLRKIGRDGLLVYMVSLAGLYASESFSTDTMKTSSPGAYTDNPEF